MEPRRLAAAVDQVILEARTVLAEAEAKIEVAEALSADLHAGAMLDERVVMAAGRRALHAAQKAHLVAEGVYAPAAYARRVYGLRRRRWWAARLVLSAVRLWDREWPGVEGP